MALPTPPSATTPRFGLRPGPPPEPVADLPKPWWALVLLLVLGLFILWVRLRSRRFHPTPESLLKEAIAEGKLLTAPSKLNYEKLFEAFRQYLARTVHPGWMSYTSAEAKKAWENTFSANGQQDAQSLTRAWETAEKVKFGQEEVTWEAIQSLLNLAEGVLQFAGTKKASHKDEKSLLSRTISQVSYE